ncbi:hypothetical protein ABTP18_20230, partial [Acinetobacter baumannii]
PDSVIEALLGSPSSPIGQLGLGGLLNSLGLGSQGLLGQVATGLTNALPNEVTGLLASLLSGQGLPGLGGLNSALSG